MAPAATGYAADLRAIHAAAARLAGRAHVTPLVSCQTLSRVAGLELRLKCENMQKVGAFKYRGATNAVAMLDDAAAARGVVTHSSGNHAQALALAARERGVAAHIVMPSNAPGVKRRAVLGYGARVIPCEPTMQGRAQAVAEVIERTGATLIAPFDHPDVIAGQGTVALEIVAQWPEVEAIVAPIGGGGLISGIALAIKALRPTVRVIAAEPAWADDAARSKRAGSIQPLAPTLTIADGLRTTLGELTFPVVRDLVDEVVTVSEEEIVAAMRLVWERAKLVIEPSSAVAVAVALAGRSAALAELSRPGAAGAPAVAVVLSGGNVDLDALPWCGPEVRPGGRG